MKCSIIELKDLNKPSEEVMELLNIDSLTERHPFNTFLHLKGDNRLDVIATFPKSVHNWILWKYIKDQLEKNNCSCRMKTHFLKWVASINDVIP